MRQKEEIVEILCGFIAEIQSAIELIKDFEEAHPDNRNPVYRQGVYRVCLNSIMLNLAKYLEFHEKYNKELHNLVPVHTDDRRHWAKIFIEKGVKEFRNKYLAHIRCKNDKRTLTYNEIDAYVYKICGGKSALDFFELLSPEKSGVKGFIQMVEEIRDDILVFLPQ